MRTAKHVQNRVQHLTGKRLFVWVSSFHLQRGNAAKVPYLPLLQVHPVYLDPVLVDQNAMDATLLHEMGLAQDWLLSLTLSAALLFALAAFSGLATWHPLVFAGGLLFMGLTLAVRTGAEGFFERRADAWASPRMVDYYRHKDAV